MWSKTVLVAGGSGVKFMKVDAEMVFNSCNTGNNNCFGGCLSVLSKENISGSSFCRSSNLLGD